MTRTATDYASMLLWLRFGAIASTKHRPWHGAGRQYARRVHFQHRHFLDQGGRHSQVSSNVKKFELEKIHEPDSLHSQVMCCRLVLTSETRVRPRFAGVNKQFGGIDLFCRATVIEAALGVRLPQYSRKGRSKHGRSRQGCSRPRPSYCQPGCPLLKFPVF
jgi:hypothetical protein